MDGIKKDLTEIRFVRGLEQEVPDLSMYTFFQQLQWNCGRTVYCKTRAKGSRREAKLESCK